MDPTQCPVCKRIPIMLQDLDYGEQLIVMAEPMYQFSYKGKRGYISPRCYDCLDKAMKKRRRRKR